MVEAARKIIQAAVVDYIKKQHQLNYSKIAESIGVHRSHIQKVAKCVCPLSQKKFDLLCQVWSIDITDITKRMELDDSEALKWRTLKKVIEIQKIDFEEISAKTGISLFTLNRIMRGKDTLTEEYYQKLLGVVDIDSYMVDQGHLAVVLELIEKGLWFINVDRSVIETVLKYVEMEI